MKPVNLTVAPPAEAAKDPPDAEIVARSRHDPEQFAVLFRRHAA
jgi:hypothetical protein